MTISISGTGLVVMADGVQIFPVLPPVVVTPPPPPPPPPPVISPDNSQIVAPTTDTLVTKDGTWSFAATGDAGPTNWDVMLNGKSAAGARGTLLKVAKGGVMYLKNSLAQWFSSNGTAFVQTSDPGGVVVVPPPPPPPPSGTPQVIPPIGASVAAGAAVSTIQAALNSCPAGTRLEMGAGSYNWNGGTVRGKAGVMVRTNGFVTINGAGAGAGAPVFDCRGLGGWTVRGDVPGNLVVNNGLLVDASGGASDGAIGCAVFNSGSSSIYDGAAIRFSGSTRILIINNDFFDVDSTMIGMFDWDNITVDGNRVDGGTGQFCSIQNGGDTTRGRGIIFRRNLHTNWGRCVYETAGTADGSDSGTPTYFQNLLMDSNQFIGYGNSRCGSDIVNSAAPISVVARAQTGSQYINNYIEKGSFPLPRGGYTEGIETNNVNGGPIVERNNVIVNIGGAFAIYGSADVDGSNKCFGCGGTAGAAILGSQPARPAFTRIAW